MQRSHRGVTRALSVLRASSSRAALPRIAVQGHGARQRARLLPHGPCTAPWGACCRCPRARCGGGRWHLGLILGDEGVDVRLALLQGIAGLQEAAPRSRGVPWELSKARLRRLGRPGGPYGPTHLSRGPSLQLGAPVSPRSALDIGNRLSSAGIRAGRKNHCPPP